MSQSNKYSTFGDGVMVKQKSDNKTFSIIAMADRTPLTMEEEEEVSLNDDLQFQDFSDTKLLDDVGDSEMNAGGASGIMLGDEDEDDTELLSGKKKLPPFWSFEYYQQFFDVDTSQVGRRLLGSFVPQFGQTYLDSHLRPSPDLYGPFWVCITLVFTLVISADLSLYSQESYEEAHHNTHFSWINRAALMVFLYTWLVPVILYAELYWRGVPTGQTFIEMVCLYGYSLTLFVPASLLCIIGNDYVRGIIVLVTCGLAGYVLLTSLWKGLEKDNNKIGLITLVCLALLHIAFAFAFLMFYISFADVTTTAAIIPTPNDSKVPAVLKP